LRNAAQIDRILRHHWIENKDVKHRGLTCQGSENLYG